MAIPSLLNRAELSPCNGHLAVTMGEVSNQQVRKAICPIANTYGCVHRQLHALDTNRSELSTRTWKIYGMKGA